MTAPHNPCFNPPPPLSDDLVREIILQFAKKRFYIRTFDRNEPLFRCLLSLPDLGKHVYVELLPSLALRVRDHVSGEVLVQSMPANFDQVDVHAPSIEERFKTLAARSEPLSRSAEGSDNDA